MPEGRTLVIDSASEACSVALVEGGRIIDFQHEVIGRGHAERLVPLIAELVDGGRAASIAVGCGPGSFAGVRIGVAAGAAAAIADADGALIVMEGGHGQWFVQPFAADLTPRAGLRSLLPDEAIGADDELVIGNRAEAFVARRGRGRAVPLLPDARAFPNLPARALFADPSPIYGRAPDAKPMATA